MIDEVTKFLGYVERDNKILAEFEDYLTRFVIDKENLVDRIFNLQRNGIRANESSKALDNWPKEGSK